MSGKPDSALDLIRSFAAPLQDTVIVTTAGLEFPGPEIVYVNPAFIHATGYLLEDVIGKTPRLLQGIGTDRAELKRMRETLQDESRFFGSILNYTKDGREIIFDWHITPIQDDQGAIKYWISVQHGVSDFKQFAQRPTLNVLVIHRDASMRSGLRETLELLAITPEFHEAEDYAQATKMIAEKKKPDLILAETASPDFGGAESLAALRQLLPSVPIVALSAVQNENSLRAALGAGVNAYVTLSSARELMPEVLRLVLAGGTFVPWEQIDSFSRSDRTNSAKRAAEFAQIRLTRRQKEIGAMLTQGLSNDQIAARLGLSIVTVKAHVMRTCRALGVENRTQAALKFRDWGFE